MTATGDEAGRFERGWAQLTRVNGTDDPKVWRRMRELSPDLARMIVEFGYGDAYADRRMDVLDERQRQLVTIGALAATAGCERQLGVHVNVGLEVGLTPDQVVEAVLHALPYVGFPRTLNAMDAVREVFERRGVWPSDATAPAPPASGGE